MGDVKIKAVAIRHIDGRIFTLPPPARHMDLFHLLPKGELLSGTQGFVTNQDLFVNRTTAYQIAVNANQLIDQSSLGYTPTPGTLYSEDLW